MIFKKTIKILQNLFHSKDVGIQASTNFVEHKSQIDDYDKLNFFLSQDGITVKIDVCGTNLNNEYAFTLLGFKLNYLNKYLSLHLVLTEDKNYHFEPIFKHIKSITFVEKEHAVKIWIESDSDIGRFFLYNITLEGDLITTNTANYRRQPEDYEKYAYSDPLMYYSAMIKENHQVILEKYFNTKNGKKCGLILTRLDDQCTIYLTTKYRSEACIYFSVENREVHIEDIIHSYINEGIGTEAVNLLIEYAKSKSYKRIYGSLADVDNDHKDRRNYFYQKLGFDVNDAKKRIQMILE